MKAMGLIPPNTEMARREPEVKPWAQLSPDEQARRSREMEVYAAMITAGDVQIGRLLDHLRQIGEYDNTEIIFISDNGPNAETIDFYGGDQINKSFNNSLENIGNPDSFAMYGPGWAQASAGPLRLYKGFVAEGGIRTSMIVSGPGLARSGQTTDAFTDVVDVAPTILDMAGVKGPGIYDGRAILPMQGRSFLPFLSGKQEAVHPADEAIGSEMWGRGAVRKGDWKLLWVESPFGSGRWELYNLKTDMAEAHDLSTAHPDKVKEMLADWDSYVRDNGVIVALGHGIGGTNEEEPGLGDVPGQ